jgi:hypothetical protein
VVTQRDLLAFDGGRQACVVFQYVGAGDDVDVTGFGVRLAGVQGFQGGQFIVALAQDFHGATQDARTLHGGHGGPDFLAFFSADNGAFDVFFGRTLHLGEDFAVSRVDGIEGSIAAGVGVAAVDVEFLQFETGHKSSQVHKWLALIVSNWCHLTLATPIHDSSGVKRH